MRKDERQYAIFILLWIALIALIILPSLLPERGQTIIYAILAFPTLYIAATFAPFFRSLKAISAFQTFSSTVNEHVDCQELIAEAKAMMSSSNYLAKTLNERWSKGSGYMNKFDEVCGRLSTCSANYKREAENLEQFLGKLRNAQ